MLDVWVGCDCVCCKIEHLSNIDEIFCRTLLHIGPNFNWSPNTICIDLCPCWIRELSNVIDRSCSLPYRYWGFLRAFVILWHSNVIDSTCSLPYSRVISVVEFSKDTKLYRFLPKNQYTRKKLLYFVNWCSSKSSKIGHHFRK